MNGQKNEQVRKKRFNVDKFLLYITILGNKFIYINYKAFILLSAVFLCFFYYFMSQVKPNYTHPLLALLFLRPGFL